MIKEVKQSLERIFNKTIRWYKSLGTNGKKFVQLGLELLFFTFVFAWLLSMTLRFGILWVIVFLGAYYLVRDVLREVGGER